MIQHTSKELQTLLQSAYIVHEDCDDLEIRAKKTLQEVANAIIRIPASDNKSYLGNPINYIYHLEYIYFELLNGKYQNACNEVEKYLQFYPITERSIRDGLISVFKKFKII